MKKILTLNEILDSIESGKLKIGLLDCITCYPTESHREKDLRWFFQGAEIEGKLKLRKELYLGYR